MHLEQTFLVKRPPEVVFDYVTNPDKLTEWQTSKTRVEPLTEAPSRQGSRFREFTKPPGGREFEQVTEFTEFDRPNRLHVHIVEGRYPIDGTWTFEANDGDSTTVRFVADGELTGLMRLLGPIAKQLLTRQFAGYHEKLRRNVEAG